MRFRPCIDIHNGHVKQIVGGSLLDTGDLAINNFISEKNGDYYATLFHDAHLTGGHAIILNPPDSPYYEADLMQAELALSAFPGELQIGGGINPENATKFLDMGASHVIVTSYVFKDGHLNYENLAKLEETVGKERLVLDLSCRKREADYYIVTDRWQNFTNEVLDTALLNELSGHCDEFLVHGVDVEGMTQGIERELVTILGKWAKKPITYAGGVSTYEDLILLKELGRDRIDVTIGSALDVYGGKLELETVLQLLKCF